MVLFVSCKIKRNICDLRDLIIIILCYSCWPLLTYTRILKRTQSVVYFESKSFTRIEHNKYIHGRLYYFIYKYVCFNILNMNSCAYLYIPCHHVLYSRIHIHQAKKHARSLTQEYGSGLSCCGRSRMKNQWVFSNHNSWTPVYTLFYNFDIYV